MQLRSVSNLLFASVLAAAMGCVSTGRFDSIVKERDAIASQNARLAEQTRQLEASLADLEEQRDELAAQKAQRESELAEMRGTYDSLVSELQGELQSGQVKIRQLADGISVDVSDDILFSSGSANLDDEGQTVLGKVSSQLTRGPYLVEVQGHTDNVPISDRLSSRYPSNWELAGARAARVVRFLEEKGIDDARLAAVSYGPTRPRASNTQEQGRKLNRRIELRLKPVPPTTPARQTPASRTATGTKTPAAKVDAN